MYEQNKLAHTLFLFSNYLQHSFLMQYIEVLTGYFICLIDVRTVLWIISNSSKMRFEMCSGNKETECLCARNVFIRFVNLIFNANVALDIADKDNFVA